MGKHAIPPDISLFGKLGARSRAFPMVVTELVDNSLDSWLEMPNKLKDGISLEVNISVTEGKNAWFTIEDNAGGMTEEELAKALTVAHSEKQANKKLLGSFGFGLKSAAMYIGSQFYIYTCSHKDPKTVWFVEFNREEFEKRGTWEIQIESISFAEAGRAGAHFRHKHGTFICVRNEKYRSAHKVGILNRLTRTFGPRLPLSEAVRKREPKSYKYDPMIIRFNDDEVIASGPFYEQYKKPNADFLEKHPQHEPSKGTQEAPALDPRYDIVEIPETAIHGKRIYGRAAIIDRGMGHNNQYGFDLIKNGRVIETNEKDRDKDDIRVGLLTSQHNARIVGQLFIDDWETDHQKTEFIKDSEDWLKLGEYVRRYVKPLLGISFSLQNPQKRKKEEQSLQEQIADEYLPTLGNIVQHAVRSEAVKEALQEIESSEKKKKEREDTKNNPPKTNAPRSRVEKPEKKASTTQLLFTKPSISYDNVGKNKPIKSSRIVKEGKATILKVALNLDHPFFQSRESAELKAIGQFLAVDAFAEYVFEEKGLNDHDDFIKVRDTLLTELKVR